MNRQNQCAKCASPDLLPIPPEPGDELHIALGMRGMRRVTVKKYVCGECGYIEEWVEDERDLTELKKEYGPNVIG
jgi:hypothetical protein